ncbi:hypothetical protein CsatA_016743 [Cannabis sativa]
MGNCITSKHQISGEDHVQYDHEVQDSSETQLALSTPSKLEDLKKLAKKKNRVRFKVEEEEADRDDQDDGVSKCSSSSSIGNIDSKSGVVRIRLVVTQQELKQILNYKKNNDCKVSSLEQLLSEMKLSRRSKVLEVEEKSSDNNGTWSPALETIPEDH